MFFRRLFGLILVITGLVGTLFSIAAIVTIWQYKNPTVDGISRTLQLFDTSLTTTADGLELTDQSLDTAKTNVTLLKATIQSTSRALSTSTPVIDTLIVMLEEDLPTTISATQTSLITARTSAALIEDALRILTSLPLVPGEAYNPEVTLETSLTDVSTSLEPMLTSFDEITRNLRASRGNLILIEAEFNIIARQIEDINANLSDAQAVLSEYRGVVDELHAEVTNTREKLPAYAQTLAWFLTFVLIWLAITQIGLLTQGLDMWRQPVVVTQIVEDD